MIEDGQVVTLEYTVRREDGSIVDSTGSCGPIAVMYGSGQLFPALEDRVGTMSPGETRTFSLPPEETFGDRDSKLVAPVPRERLPADLSVVVGERYRLKGADGRGIPFRVVAVEDGVVMADFNDPNAGETLEATVTMVAVRDATPAEARRGRV